MEDKIKIVPKIVKSNLRGVLLSKPEGINIWELLYEYQKVTRTPLGYQVIGFTNIVEFLKSVPDVARIVRCDDGSIKVLGIALNGFNIVANKCCFKESDGDSNDEPNHLPIQRHKVPLNQSPPRGSKSYDFRVEFMKDKCPGLEVKKINTNTETCYQQGSTDLHAEIKKMNVNDSNSHHNNNCNSNNIDYIRMDDQGISHENKFEENCSKRDLKYPIKRNGPYSDEKSVQMNGYETSVKLGIIPRSMLLCKLQQMFNDIHPDGSPLHSDDFPSTITVMVTHVEHKYKNYFWGIIIEPYRSEINGLLSLNDHKDEFKKYKGGKRAIIFHEMLYCRAWVKAVEGETASVFMVDFGNTEEVLAEDLLEAPPSIWKCQPLAVPFRHDPSKNYHLEAHVNKPMRCCLSKLRSHVFVVDDLISMNLYREQSE